MKLIDVDALRDYWHISELCESCHWSNIDCSKPSYYSLLDICKAIDEIPVVDAIPVEWLETQINEALDDNESELASDIGWLIRKYINEQEAR